MQIHLAPMEGVVNARMRALLTSAGGIDRCITEFVRVTNQLLPPRVFHRLCPELQHDGKTPSGVPVYVQLLGSEPLPMADNAARAAELGALGVDLNFGCPAKCVNRHRGGSVLLDEPELIHNIVGEIRAALPKHCPLTVKIRLGYRDRSRFLDVVAAIVDGGAQQLTVHARTRDDGYTPPAHWHEIAPAGERFAIPIVANGEIWSPTDAEKCLNDSGCNDIMLGRGILSRPDLALSIKAAQAGDGYQDKDWQQIFPMVRELFQDSLVNCAPRHVGGPVKQWLGYLRRHYPEAAGLFEEIKRLRAPQDLQAALLDHQQAA